MKKSETSATGLSRRSPLYLIAVLLLAVIIFFVQGRLDTREEPSETRNNETIESTKTTESTENTSHGNTENSYAFRSEKLLNQHFEKHGIEMGFATAEEYLAAANKVILSPKVLHKKEAEDNDDVYYLEESNEFVVVSTDGYIRTYFLPEDGIRYYNRQ